MTQVSLGMLKVCIFANTIEFDMGTFRQINTLIVLFLFAYPVIAQCPWRAVGPDDSPTSTGISNAAAGYLSIAISANSTPYLAFRDAANGQRAGMMKYEGNNWVNVGNRGFSAGEAIYLNAALDAHDMPYVVYGDHANSGRASVMKYDGTSWSQVGSAGFSAGEVFYTDICFDNGGTAYVAFIEQSASNRVSVMKFDGSSWVYVGSQGFTAANAWYVSLAVDVHNNPYVAFSDRAAADQISVMRFDGSNWVYVGNPGVSIGKVKSTDIAFDRAGNAYIAYSDEAYGYKACVSRFDGADWLFVGTGGFSAAEAVEPRIALDKDEIAYVLYSDMANGGRVTAMYFDGRRWTNAGVSGFSNGTAGAVSMAIDKKGIVHAAFTSTFAFVKKFGIEMKSQASPSFLCQGGRVILGSSVKGRTYQWTGPQGFMSSAENPVIDNILTGQGGTYRLTLTDSNGCMARDTANVQVNPNPVAQAIANSTSLCAGEKLELSARPDMMSSYNWIGPDKFSYNGQNTGITSLTRSDSGYYVLTVTDWNGCRGIDSVLASVKPMPDNSILQNEYQLFANQNGARYQWYQCNLMQPIAGEQRQFFNITKTGRFAVIIDLEGCIDTSECIIISSVGLDEFYLLNQWTFFPNPAAGKIWVTASRAMEMDLMDISGKHLVTLTVEQGVNELELGVRKGLYLLREKGSAAIRKLVVE